MRISLQACLRHQLDHFTHEALTLILAHLLDQRTQRFRARITLRDLPRSR